DERVREEPHAEWRGHWPVVGRSVEMQNSGDRAYSIRGGNERSLRGALHRVALIAQYGMHDDGRQEAKRGKPDRSQVRERSFDAAPLELVRRQGAQIPGEPEHGGEQEQWVETEAQPRS